MTFRAMEGCPGSTASAERMCRYSSTIPASVTPRTVRPVVPPLSNTATWPLTRPQPPSRPE
ncbi:hypothetical protein FJV41_48085 [Myxococcus llanfairpwllgwyngyllgogerychwyrndrobwllllantysiliogogogochensis]|uniref:Uncharacterized protein n=1 Tax=Myxococcus llanfairpwllgwyngyllgogerychwyrndrobwllllantysiliogogogochensis TaxID=2590453 RepID=A0A540WIC8_9BACT|nr:hypothetical protein [Myxococcus llanfairpwllgwyngyllgogerychwyrndrobwllllantysiliogogogochensis]TQF08779.1 hypothetical protein FJV41_48085 [Myxococcus llanfairpwllgwyngyllgogerychwyrndrobwllllantysiliogogogochensis]